VLRNIPGAKTAHRQVPSLRSVLAGAAMIAMSAAAGESGLLSTDASCCSLIELRQYTLHAGQRDVLIGLFDREFIETQEAVGIAVIGQFRDLDRPDRFVWLRGFRDIETRGQALAAFYDGPVWHSHREAANATMIDSDNVLLLEPVGPARGISALPDRPSNGIPGDSGPGLIVATLYYTQPDSLPVFTEVFDRSIRKSFERAGARTVAEYATSAQFNSFPRLPIRVGEHIFLWLARFASANAFENYRTQIAKDREWQMGVWPTVRKYLVREPEVLRLAPTDRSRLHG
jgi:NIPSNAP